MAVIDIKVPYACYVRVLRASLPDAFTGLQTSSLVMRDMYIMVERLKLLSQINKVVYQSILQVIKFSLLTVVRTYHEIYL